MHVGIPLNIPDPQVCPPCVHTYVGAGTAAGIVAAATGVETVGVVVAAVGVETVGVVVGVDATTVGAEITGAVVVGVETAGVVVGGGDTGINATLDCGAGSNANVCGAIQSEPQLPP